MFQSIFRSTDLNSREHSVESKIGSQEDTPQISGQTTNEDRQLKLALEISLNTCTINNNEKTKEELEKEMQLALSISEIETKGEDANLQLAISRSKVETKRTDIDAEIEFQRAIEASKSTIQRYEEATQTQRRIKEEYQSPANLQSAISRASQKLAALQDPWKLSFRDSLNETVSLDILKRKGEYSGEILLKNILLRNDVGTRKPPSLATSLGWSFPWMNGGKHVDPNQYFRIKSINPFTESGNVEMAIHLVQCLRTASTKANRVVNFDLACNFIRCVKSMVRKYGVKGMELDIGFHWTPQQNMRNIADMNFRDGRNGRLKVAHGSVYGAGIYHCGNPYSSEEFGKGNQEVIVSLVCCGKFSTGQTRAHGCDSNGTGRDYNSYCFVVYDSNQVLPAFTVKKEDLRTVVEILIDLRQEIYNLVGLVGVEQFKKVEVQESASFGKGTTQKQQNNDSFWSFLWCRYTADDC